MTPGQGDEVGGGATWAASPPTTNEERGCERQALSATSDDEAEARGAALSGVRPTGAAQREARVRAGAGAGAPEGRALMLYKRNRTAPVVRILNAGGQRVEERDRDGNLRYCFTGGAVIEFRPESEKLTERQAESQREKMRELLKDPRFVRLADRETGTGEDETPKRGED